MNTLDHLNALAARPTCDHGLNGPCKVCGPPTPLRALLGDPIPDDPADLERGAL